MAEKVVRPWPDHLGADLSLCAVWTDESYSSSVPPTAFGKCYDLKLPNCSLKSNNCVVFYNFPHTFVPYLLTRNYSYNTEHTTLLLNGSVIHGVGPRYKRHLYNTNMY